jgi:hypothetical protein
VCCALECALQVEYFHDHVRLEQMLIEGAACARGGRLRPDVSRPGLGLEFKRADADKYLV